MDHEVRLLLQQGIDKLGLNLPESTVVQLLEYIQEFQRWNKMHNLSAIHSLEESVSLHLLDSLAVLNSLDGYLKDKPRKILADLGTGGGLPGIVLAICRPEWTVYLMEAVSKKVAFLEHIKGRLGLSNVRVISGRIEVTSKNLVGAVTACISRAFSDFGKFVELSKPLLEPGGMVWAMKAKLLEEDLKTIPKDWSIQVDLPLVIPGLQAERRLVGLVPHATIRP